MRSEAKTNTLSLTLFDPSDESILGELTDAEWVEETSSAGVNFVLSGFAGDGTVDSLATFMDRGADTVNYEFFDGTSSYQGDAFLLRPSRKNDQLVTEVRIESPNRPRPKG